MNLKATALVTGLLCAGITIPDHAMAATCGGNFDRWLDGFRSEARAQGVSARALSALDGVSRDGKVIAADRKQGVFAQSFLEFSGRMVSGYRLKNGAALINRHRALFERIEQRFGVPAPVITAFWALETDFGGYMGNFATLQSLATLAHDCRRPELFRPQLIAALRLIDNGDLEAQDMIGAWAGEIGQTQFQPSEYMETAVDFDGDGRRDLIHSVPDMLASTAALLARFGWRRGEPWLQEVTVPASLPWDQADLTVRLARSQWVKWGVRATSGTLPADAMPASLILPMGRNGPAFLAYPNFQIAYLEWNKSLVYALTAAYLATRLDGAPKVSPGRAPVETLSLGEMKQLQTLLKQRGYDVGDVDGILGEMTRSAVKDMQAKLGLPADSYPTPDLLERLN